MNRILEYQNLLPQHGELYYFPPFLALEEADDYFGTFLKKINWKQRRIRLFGKEILQPRMTAEFADDGVTYGYSGIWPEPDGWTPELLNIKSKIGNLTEVNFNTALLNLYRHGGDSMGWHRDNEKELGEKPVIASLSLGQTRIFRLRDHRKKSGLISIPLVHGSLLLMSGESQQFWEHSVPKTSERVGERINVTFRKVVR